MDSDWFLKHDQDSGGEEESESKEGKKRMFS